MSHRHGYDNSMLVTPIYYGRNMDLADWLLQIEKVALLINSTEYALALAKSTSTPYNMLKRMVGARSLHEIRKKLEEEYSPISTEVHATSDLHSK